MPKTQKNTGTAPQLFRHQARAIKRALAQNLCLFHDCGTGKTRTGLEIARQHKLRGVGPTLMVTLNRDIIIDAWLPDAKKFTPDLVVKSFVHRYDGKHLGGERMRKVFKEMKADVYCCHWHALKTMYREICRFGFKVMIFDESSKLKDFTSAITQATLSLAGINYRRGNKFVAPKAIPFRYCLSATPAPNHEGEYWSQIKFVTGRTGVGASISDSPYVFRKNFYTEHKLAGNQCYWEFRRDMAQQLVDAIGPWCDVVRKRDVLDLPPVTIIPRRVTLGRREREAYEDMKKDAFYQLDKLDITDSVVAVNALARLQKLRQITSGFLYRNDEEPMTNRRPVALGQTKTKALVELLEEIKGQQVLIFCNYTPEVEAILQTVYAVFRQPGQSMGQVIRAAYGGAKDTSASIQAFKNRDCQYLVANYAGGCASHGINLTNCHSIIYYSMNFSYEQFKQSKDRIDRHGQKEPMTIWSLMASGTVDEEAYAVCMKKMDLNAAAMSAIKKLQGKTNFDQWSSETSVTVTEGS